MKKKTIIVFVILMVIAAAFVTYSAVKQYKEDKQRQSIVEKYDESIEHVSYDAASEIKDAEAKLDSIEDGAAIIRDNENQEETTVALVFAGINDRSNVERALALLDRYKVKATFCITGSMAAEDDELVTLINKKGHLIADNGLNGDTGMEQYSSEELIDNFATSGKIISVSTGKAPNMLMCNSTFYADNVTTAAKACGYDKLISASSGKFINAGSFKYYKNTKEYTSKLKGANILVVKLDGYLDAYEYEVGDRPYSLPNDMPATLNLEKKEEDEEEKEEETDIEKTLNWLLEALKYTNVDVVSIYNMKAYTDKEYIEDLLKKGAGNEAETVTSIKTIDKAWGLAYIGLPDEETAKTLAKALINSEMEATFFVDGEDVDNNPESLKLLSDCGFKFASRGYSGEDLSDLDNMEIYHELYLLDRKIKANEGRTCKYYLPPSGKITQNVSKVAGALGYTIYIPENIINNNSGASSDGYYTKDNGSIYCMDASDPKIIANTEAIIKAAKNSDKKIYTLKGIIAASKAKPVIDEKEIAEVRKANEGNLAAETNFVYTTEKAFSFTFFGISNRTTLNDVLNKLDARGYKATFFATYDEFIKCEDQVKKILESGNELGLAYVETKDYPQEFDSVAGYILAAKSYIDWQYDFTPTSIMMPYGEVMDETKEAVSACDMNLVGRDMTLVQSKYAACTDISEFYYPLTSKIELHRGSIVYFNMNAFEADKTADKEGNEDPLEDSASSPETMTGKLLDKFIRNKVSGLTYQDVYGKYIASTMYSSKSVNELMNSRYTWTPGYGAKMISSDKNVLTDTLTYAGCFPYMKERYVGNYNAGGENSLPGFTEEERNALDVSGRFTNDPVLFLTFDDWGTDYSINQILYVLKKYNVKATFFIKTKYVSANPNLLRAIAADGHQIASHSYDHLPLSDILVDDPVNSKYVYGQLTEEEANKLRSDIVTSYGILNKYVGNVYVGGKSALSQAFRPPTLAVSRLGLYEVFDVGYTHAISGDFSTNDYEAQSLDSLVNLLRNGRSTWDGNKKVQSGSVIVMHMTETAQYTAEALDIMIPEWQSMGFSFARIDDYLK